MKKLVFILAALFFIDMGVYAQRAGRSSERSSSNSRKEESATRSSSSSRSSAVRSSSSSSGRSSSQVRPSSSSNRSSSVSRSGSSRSEAVTPGNSRSSSGRTVSPSSNGSSGNSNSYGRSSSSGNNNGYNRSSSSRQSSGYSNGSSSRSNGSYSSSGTRNSSSESYRNGRSNQSNASRSSSDAYSRSRVQKSDKDRGNGGNDYVGNNGDRRYRDNGNKFENRGTKTRTYWDRSGNSGSSNGSGGSGTIERNNRNNTTNRESTRTSVDRIVRQPETRTSVRRIERNTPNGVVIDTRGTTYQKNYHVVRETRVIHHHVVRPRPIEYRRVHYIYRAPRHWNFFWSVNIYNDFRGFYPHVTHWHYRTGARISTISAYDAMFFIGEVKRVYGEVQEVFYSREDDAYYLYIGARFPYHDFSVVIPGREYRRYDFPPINRLNFQHIWAMGLITEYDERPEILVKRPYQLGIY